MEDHIKPKKPPGRKKGVPNKFTQVLKEAIEASFSELGGKDYLVALGRDQPKAYCQILCKVLPQAQEITVEDKRDDPRALAIGVDQPPEQPGA